jgi:hypothetical protein
MQCHGFGFCCTAINFDVEGLVANNLRSSTWCKIASRPENKRNIRKRTKVQPNLQTRVRHILLWSTIKCCKTWKTGVRAQRRWRWQRLWWFQLDIEALKRDDRPAWLQFEVEPTVCPGSAQDSTNRNYWYCPKTVMINYGFTLFQIRIIPARG